MIHFYQHDRVELYSVKEDIGERNNLAGKMPQKTAELRKLLDAWLREVDATICPLNPEWEAKKQ